MLQMRVILPDNFELEDGVLSEEGRDWATIYQALLVEKGGCSNFQVVRVKT